MTKGLVRCPGRPHQAESLSRRRNATTTLLLVLLSVYTLDAPSANAQKETPRPPVVPLSGGGSSSSIGIIVGCVVAIVGVVLITAIIALLCVLRRRRRLGYGRSHLYADADSVALQDDDRSHRYAIAVGAGQNEGTGTAGQHSHSTVVTNEPVTPPQDATAPAQQQQQQRDPRDNYADRRNDRRRSGNDDEEGEDDDDGVRPASPTAARVEGVAIETRVRPRRNLPRGQVVIHHENQDICLDFRGVERVPQAGPPPLTAEEKQRILDAQNRVASPEFYGRAEYEHRHSSNRNTPNVLLSSSLLRDLQRQYATGTPSGQVFPSYASDTGHSIASMSFRPGSPAGSVRRGHRDGRQSTSPTSVAMGGSRLRHRKRESRHHTGSRDASDSHPHAANSRNYYHDDLESTSDDFEDLSLHNDSFTARHDKPRDGATGDYLAPPSTTAGVGFPALGASLGFDQMSLRSSSPGAFERYASAPGSVNGAAVMNGSTTSGFGVPSPFDHPQEPPAAWAHSPHGLQSTQSNSITSPVGWSAAALRSPPNPTGPRPPTTAGSEKRSSKSHTGSAHSTSSATSPGMPPTAPNLSPLPALLSPSNPIIQFVGVPVDAGVRSGTGRDTNGGPATTTTLEVDSRATVSGAGAHRGLHPRHVDVSPGGSSGAHTPAQREGLPPTSSLDSSGGDRQRAQASPVAFLRAVAGTRDTRDSSAPLPRLAKGEAKATGSSRGPSTHSKSD